MKWAKIYCLSAALIASVTYGLAETPEHWEAASRTADATTGNVTFTPTKITMAKNVTFAIKFVRTAPGVTWMPAGNADTASSLYRMTQSKNPVLLNRNRLCGQKAVTYISIAKAAHQVFLSAYTGEDAPTVGRNNLCAGYTYLETPSRGHSN